LRKPVVRYRGANAAAREGRSQEQLEAEPEQTRATSLGTKAFCRRTVALWRSCDSTLHRPAEAPPRAVSGRRVGVSVAVSDQTRQAPAQALDLPLVLLELDLAGAALLENRAREDETFDS
jgi:hypothetical protein